MPAQFASVAELEPMLDAVDADRSPLVRLSNTRRNLSIPVNSAGKIRVVLASPKQSYKIEVESPSVDLDVEVEHEACRLSVVSTAACQPDRKRWIELSGKNDSEISLDLAESSFDLIRFRRLTVTWLKKGQASPLVPKNEVEIHLNGVQDTSFLRNLSFKIPRLLVFSSDEVPEYTVDVMADTVELLDGVHLKLAKSSGGSGRRIDHLVLHQKSIISFDISSSPNVGTIRACKADFSFECAPVVETNSQTDLRPYHSIDNRRRLTVSEIHGPLIVSLGGVGDGTSMMKVDKEASNVLVRHGEQISTPPSVFALGGEAIATGVQFDGDDSGAAVTVHLEPRSVLRWPTGRLRIGWAARATIIGKSDNPVGLVGVDGGAYNRPDAESMTTSESPLREARLREVFIDLASPGGHAILEACRESQSLEPHWSTWSPDGPFSVLGIAGADPSWPLRARRFISGWSIDSIQARQQQLGFELLGEVSSSKTTSGTNRAGIAHAVLAMRRRRSEYRSERFLLSVGRFIGFGQHILLPIVVWFMAAFSMAIVVMSNRAIDFSPSGFLEFFTAVANLLVEPATLIRGVRSTSWLDLQLESRGWLSEPWVAAVVRIIITVPLASAFLAIAKRSRFS